MNNIECTFYDESGRFITALSMPDEEAIRLNAPDHGEAVAGMYDEDTFLADGHVQDIPPRPADHLTWSGRAWIDARTPAERQAALYAAREATTLDKSDLLIRMTLAGLLPAEDAEIAAGGVIPPAIQAALDALPAEVFPADAQLVARIKWRSDNIISRTNPVIVLAAVVLGITDDQLDEIFSVAIPE